MAAGSTINQTSQLLYRLKNQSAMSGIPLTKIGVSYLDNARYRNQLINFINSNGGAASPGDSTSVLTVKLYAAVQNGVDTIIAAAKQRGVPMTQQTAFTQLMNELDGQTEWAEINLYDQAAGNADCVQRTPQFDNPNNFIGLIIGAAVSVGEMIVKGQQDQKAHDKATHQAGNDSRNADILTKISNCQISAARQAYYDMMNTGYQPSQQVIDAINAMPMTDDACQNWMARVALGQTTRGNGAAAIDGSAYVPTAGDLQAAAAGVNVDKLTTIRTPGNPHPEQWTASLDSASQAILNAAKTTKTPSMIVGATPGVMRLSSPLNNQVVAAPQTTTQKILGNKNTVYMIIGGIIIATALYLLVKRSK